MMICFMLYKMRDLILLIKFWKNYANNLIFDVIQTLLKFNNRQIKSYKQLRKSWKKKLLRNMKKSCFIITFKTETLWLLDKSYNYLKHIQTDCRKNHLFLFIIWLFQIVCIDMSVTCSVIRKYILCQIQTFCN